MMVSSEERGGERPARLGLPLLSMLAGYLTVFGFIVDGHLSRNTLWDPQYRNLWHAIVFNLLLVAGIAALGKVRSSRPRILAQLALLAMAAFMVSGATISILKHLHARDYLGLWYWKTLGLVAGNLLVLGGSICGAWLLAPWKTLNAAPEPVSPATRRTQALFGLAGVVGVLAVVVLLIGIGASDGNPVWSNRQNVPLALAVVAILIWLVSIALSWWWYHSADEHERRANDVGFLAGGGLFMAVTPVWWILSRAGVLPPPDAMVLWYATILAMGIGWAWHRNR